MTTSNDRSGRSAVPETPRRKNPRPEAVEFGRRVRAGRKVLRLSQEQLGERSGLHRTYIGHIERGEVNPTLHNVLLLAEALGVDASQLVRGLRTDDHA
jgi:transcriptional regulator with XRE-family HTH domain